MRVDRQDAPGHAVRARRELRQRHPKQGGVACVDLRIALVDRLAAWVRYPNGGEGRLEPLREPQLDLRGPRVDRAAYGGHRGGGENVRPPLRRERGPPPAPPPPPPRPL